MNKTYETYKNEVTECPYCKSMTNLYDIKRHIKGKRCQKFKSLFFAKNINKSEADIELFLNDLKKDVLYRDNDNKSV